MKKKVFGRHFSRSRKAREALFKSLTSAFILHGRIETTFARAKSVQGDIDEMVMWAKAGSVAAQREIASALSANRELVAKLVRDVASFKNRGSGFTKITRLPRRFGDAAEMARLEWVDEIAKSEEVKTKKEVKEKPVTKKLSTKKTKKNTKAK